MDKNNLNLKPFKYKIFFLFIKKYLFKYIFFIVPLFVFLILYKITVHPFSNNEVFSIIENNKESFFIGYHKCFYLDENNDKNLFNNINNKLLNDNKFKDDKVPNIIFAKIPHTITNLKTSEEIKLRKRVFIKILLPIITKVNLEVKEDNAKILALSNKIIKEELTLEDLNVIENLAKKYKVEVNVESFWDNMSALNNLINKANIVPNSLILAMAIKQTGWGSSKFLKEGNSLFSERTWNVNYGVSLNESNGSRKSTIRKFDSIEDSVRSYVLNLNSSDLYEKFRKTRSRMITNQRRLNSYTLANYLDKYPDEKSVYKENLRKIISDNNLTKYDNYKDFYNNKSMCISFY